MIVSSSATRTRGCGESYPRPAPQAPTRLAVHQRLREHPRVAVGVVERRELDHALDLLRLAVELRPERLEVRARGNDVLDAEGRHGAAVLELLALAEADEDSAPRRAQLAPAVLVELVDDLEAERLAVPLDGPVEVRDVHGDHELPVVLERRRERFCGGLGHACSSLLEFVLTCFYTRYSFVSIPDLIALFHHRWSAPVLAELLRQKGSRFAALAGTLGVGSDSLRRALDSLLALGLVARNPGYGHPLRPEYVLTRGRQEDRASAARSCSRRTRTTVLLRKWSLPVLAALGRPARFSELRASVPGVTPRALALALEDLPGGRACRAAHRGRVPAACALRADAAGRRLQRIVA